jgi:phosphoribosylformylglycinamidine cyclo-ligase
MSGWSYRDAGVDIEAGERLVDRIRPLAARTRTPEVLGGVGGFAGLCGLPSDIEDPVLVSGTDGVGTKLKLAFRMDVHDTVGVDLVAMCVNDIVTVGARPLFFLDYFASGQLDVDRAAKVVEGIAHGCEQAGCALLGGETAELPGFYAAGEYDVAGFAVGVVERSRIIDGSKAQQGDVVLGLPSSGLHSNGFSLARKVLLEHGQMQLDAHVEQLGEPLGQALLRPTRIYADAARRAAETGEVRALCHVTGGGLPGNLPRVLPEGLGAEIRSSSWTAPPLFDLIQRVGSVEPSEMRSTFNLGIGFAMVVRPEGASAVREALEDGGETVYDLGTVVSADAADDPSRLRFIP